MMKKIIVLIGIGFLFFLPLNKSEAAIGISASGSWSQGIHATDLTTGAGSDLRSTYASANNATILDITGAGTSNWRVFVRRTDTLWDGNFVLYVQRTSNGTGPGTISGGQAYIQVTGIDTLFFSGSRNRTGINVQYQLQGVSLNIAPTNYNTTVIFTVTSP